MDQGINMDVIVVACIFIILCICYFCIYSWAFNILNNPVRAWKLRRMRKLGRTCLNCMHYKYNGSCMCSNGSKYDYVNGKERTDWTLSANTIGTRKCKWKAKDKE